MLIQLGLLHFASLIVVPIAVVAAVAAGLAVAGTSLWLADCAFPGVVNVEGYLGDSEGACPSPYRCWEH